MFKKIKYFLHYIILVLLHIGIFAVATIESFYYIPMIIFVDREKYAHKALHSGKKKFLTLCKFIGIDFCCKGFENFPKEGNFIIASKHQASAECVILKSVEDKTGISSFILKNSLKWKLPIYGIYVYFFGDIYINRTDGIGAAKEIIVKSKEVLDKGRNLIIFPEGTRIKPGETGKYKEGIYMLYNRYKLPVVPVALNTGLFFPKGKFNKSKGTATIEFLPKIEPGMKKKEFMNKLINSIESRTRELEKEAIDKYGIDNLQK